MGAGGSPMCLSLASFKGMKSWLDRLLLWAIFLSTALQNAAVDCKRVRANELPSPNLNSSMTVVSMDQNVSLSCSSKNTSVDITYSLFLGRKHLQTKISGETVTFYLKIFNANETGPYKCKTNDSSGAKYSQEFSFTIAKDSCPSCLLSQLLPAVLLGLLVIILVLVFFIRTKYKRGKARTESESKGSGDAPMQGELYANVCETQTEAGQPQELHYATPVFKEVAPREQEGHAGNKADYVYSDLTY
ncbi:allergin-1 isoform X1 [Arvicola amphibius]|uniref:allergin-1 isoform X1 n=1 Tax=Arvicola amphibius TaxID=1047088 RepID=UPI0018E2AB6B|nr:allergin-1 isoform X1 [Arvicola amphibius]